MPDNFHPKDNENPYADYAAAELYAFVAKHGVAKPADAGLPLQQSRLWVAGAGLGRPRGCSVSRAAQAGGDGAAGSQGYGDQAFAGTGAPFHPGHDARHRAAHAWDLVRLPERGRSARRPRDMLTYVEANLRPERVKAAGAEGKTLAAALTASHELRAEPLAGNGLRWRGTMSRTPEIIGTTARPEAIAPMPSLIRKLAMPPLFC